MPKLFNHEEMKTIREAYARQLMFASNTECPAIERAFSSVPKEMYIPKPWKIPSAFKKLEKQKVNTLDPSILYQDKVFVLSKKTDVNNGSPSLHAELLYALDVNQGQSVTHIGSGSGYYTAILANLVGQRGFVTAIEYDADIAKFGSSAFSNTENVEYIYGNGFEYPKKRSDRIYVNFAVDDIPDPWIEMLTPQGKIIVPLGEQLETSQKNITRCAVIMITNNGNQVWHACLINISYFVHAQGFSSNTPSGALHAALAQARRLQSISEFHWKPALRATDAWYHGASWTLR